MVVQHATIAKQKCHKKETLLRRSYKRGYRLHIAVFFSTIAIVSAENDIFIVAGFWSAAISM